MNFTETDSSKNPAVSKDDKLYKIIKNFDYYIAATVSNDYAKSLKKIIY